MTQGDIIINVQRSSCRVPVVLVRSSCRVPVVIVRSSCIVPVVLVRSSCIVPVVLVRSSCRVPVVLVRPSCRVPVVLVRSSCRVPVVLVRSSCRVPLVLVRSSCRVPVVLVWFQSNFNFLHIFSKNTQISDFMKIWPVGAELFHADGQTDTTKLTDAFPNFTNAPKSHTHHWLPVLPASQLKTAWPTKQNCRFFVGRRCRMLAKFYQFE